MSFKDLLEWRLRFTMTVNDAETRDKVIQSKSSMMSFNTFYYE